MARPQRNNVDYFPHEVSSGKKMFYIENKYGNDGYATWYKILEELGSADYHYIDLSKQSNIMYMSAKCRVEEKTLNAIINDLVEMGVFDKEFWTQSSVIWCDKFVDSVSDAYARRSNECINRDTLCIHLSSLGIHKPSKGGHKHTSNGVKSNIKPQRIGKDSKGKDSKLDKAISDFEQMRKKIKKPMTDKAKVILLNKLDELASTEQEKIAILEKSILHSWQSVYPLDGGSKSSDPPKLSNAEQREKFISEQL